MLWFQIDYLFCSDCLRFWLVSLVLFADFFYNYYYFCLFAFARVGDHYAIAKTDAVVAQSLLNYFKSI